MPVTVRAAAASDAPALAALNDHVHDLHVAARPDVFRPAPREEAVPWFTSQLGGADSRVWIAEDGNLPVGYVLVFFHERAARPFTQPRRWCEIDQLAVAPSGRRRGTARALIDAALAETRRRGICEVELSTWAFNAAAQAVFQRLGFTPRMIRYERRMPRSAAGRSEMTKFWRLYSGSDGQSKIVEEKPDMRSFTDTEGAHGEGTAMLAAKGISFRTAPPGYVLSWHCAPRRQYSITLSGEAEIEVGDGTVARIRPGDVVLAEDLTGQGHITRVVGNLPRLSALVPLA